MRIALHGWVSGMEAALTEWLQHPGAVTRDDLIDHLRHTIATALQWTSRSASG